MARESGAALVLRKIDGMEREIARLRRDVIHTLITRKSPNKLKPSLFGSIKGGDVTEKMIDESQRNLFPNLKDI